MSQGIERGRGPKGSRYDIALAIEAALAIPYEDTVIDIDFDPSTTLSNL